MVKKRIFDHILGLFRYDVERYAVVEQSDNLFVVTEATVNELDKKIQILSTLTAKTISEIKSPLFYRNNQLILALNSESATTIESVVCVKRMSLREPITEGELEQLVFQGFWEFLNANRIFASKKMQIADLDLLLADFEIADLSVGKYRVINPIGLVGGPIIIRFRGTFVPRNLIDDIVKLKKITYNITVLERGAALSTIIAGKQHLAGFCENKKTIIFLAHENKIAFESKINWGVLNLIHTIADVFSVDENVASIILNLYLQDKISKKMSLRLSKITQKEISNLINMIYAEHKELTSGALRNVILNLHFPFSTPKIHKWFDKKRAIQTKSFEENLNKLEFSIYGEAASLHTKALILYANLRPKYEILNNLLKRRAKWLIARI